MYSSLCSTFISLIIASVTRTLMPLFIWVIIAFLFWMAFTGSLYLEHPASLCLYSGSASPLQSPEKLLPPLATWPTSNLCPLVCLVLVLSCTFQHLPILACLWSNFLAFARIRLYVHVAISLSLTRTRLCVYVAISSCTWPYSFIFSCACIHWLVLGHIFLCLLLLACTFLYALVRACTFFEFPVRTCTSISFPVRACTFFHFPVRACALPYFAVRGYTWRYFLQLPSTSFYSPVLGCTWRYFLQLSSTFFYLRVLGCTWRYFLQFSSTFFSQLVFNHSAKPVESFHSRYLRLARRIVPVHITSASCTSGLTFLTRVRTKTGPTRVTQLTL